MSSHTVTKWDLSHRYETGTNATPSKSLHMQGGESSSNPLFPQSVQVCRWKLLYFTGWGCCLFSCCLTMTTEAGCLWEHAPGESTAAREKKMNECMKCAVSRSRPCQQTNKMRVTLLRSGTQISRIHLQLPKGMRCKHCTLARMGVPGASVLLHMGELRYKTGRLRDNN